MALDVRLMPARVGHARLWPKKNSFLYKVYYVSLPVTEDEALSTPRLFSFNRWNLLSVKRRDHGARDNDVTWRHHITNEMKRAKVELSDEDSIRLITHPRLLGYAFNPISYWLVSNPEGGLKAVLCEVNNTFGDNHSYLLSKKDGKPIAPDDVMLADKQLYVSPFNTMEGYYEFKLRYKDGNFRSDINYFNRDRAVLDTFMAGREKTLTSARVLGVLLRYPFMTIMVVLRIHWQAVKLFIKRVPHTLKIRPREYRSGRTTSSKKQK